MRGVHTLSIVLRTAGAVIAPVGIGFVAFATRVAQNMGAFEALLTGGLTVALAACLWGAGEFLAARRDAVRVAARPPAT